MLFRILIVSSILGYMLVNVSAQRRCIVTPLSSIGVENVIIHCNCSDGGAPLQPIRWFDPDEDRIVGTAHRRYVAGTPYFERRPDDTNVVLVIPTLNATYAGTYTCGVGNIFPPGPPNGTVNLTVSTRGE